MEKIIIKSDGKTEPYYEKKIITSLEKSGASPGIISETTKILNKKIKDYASTDEIYRETLNNLDKKEHGAALKYSLKKALMLMGPDGFVFEKYVSKILREFGYETEVGKIIKGHCVDHEIDVIAKKDNHKYFIECKYHNSRGIKSGIKTVLYINSRFLDLEKAYNEKKGHNNTDLHIWLVTNTRCTSDAERYSRCVNMDIIAWNYPEGKNLQYYIETKKLYPITILPSLKEENIQKLFDSNIIMAKELKNFSPIALAELLSLDKPKVLKILEEADIIL